MWSENWNEKSQKKEEEWATIMGMKANLHIVLLVSSVRTIAKAFTTLEKLDATSKKGANGKATNGKAMNGKANGHAKKDS